MSLQGEFDLWFNRAQRLFEVDEACEPIYSEGFTVLLVADELCKKDPAIVPKIGAEAYRKIFALAALQASTSYQKQAKEEVDPKYQELLLKAHKKCLLLSLRGSSLNLP